VHLPPIAVVTTEMVLSDQKLLEEWVVGKITSLTTSIVGGLAIRPRTYAMRMSPKRCGIILPEPPCPTLLPSLLVFPLGAEGEGGAKEEEVEMVLFKLGAGGPLMDRGSPEMDNVAGLLAVVVVA
jgi:hypothetical protein